MIKCSMSNLRRTREGKSSFVSILDEEGKFIIHGEQTTYHTEKRTVLAQAKGHHSFHRKDPFVISNPIFDSEKDSQEGIVKVFWHND